MPRGFPELVEKARATDKLETQLFQLDQDLSRSNTAVQSNLNHPKGLVTPLTWGRVGIFTQKINTRVSRNLATKKGGGSSLDILTSALRLTPVCPPLHTLRSPGELQTSNKQQPTYATSISDKLIFYPLTRLNEQKMGLAVLKGCF